jgi:glycosyltransferase involved in cell wall biosynthesis
MKVAVSAKNFDRDVGGNTTYVREVYDRLRTDGVHATRMGTRLANRGRGLNIALMAAEALTMQAQAKAGGMDLLHYPSDTGPVRGGRIPTVMTIHGAAGLHEKGIRRPWANELWLRRTRLAGLAADVVITDSLSSKTDVEALLGATAPAVHPVALGVNFTKFFPVSPAEVARTCAAHGVSRPFAFFMGNLEPRKNLVNLVAAVDALNDRGEDLELLVGGRPAWGASATLAAIESSAHARRLGFLADSDARALMTGCRMFTFPSLYEGFGLPVLEAMACGAPVVCTARGSLPEVAGEAAIYAEDVTAGAIADAITRCLAGDRAQARRGSIQHAAPFTWELTAQRHLAIFRSVLGG